MEQKKLSIEDEHLVRMLIHIWGSYEKHQISIISSYGEDPLTEIRFFPPDPVSEHEKALQAVASMLEKRGYEVRPPEQTNSGRPQIWKGGAEYFESLYEECRNKD
jgi:hypothetical protein